MQSFFRTGGLQKYFVVATDVAANRESAVVEEIVAEQLAEYQSTQQQIEEELQVFSEAAKTDKTGWFKRTGWLEHFAKRNLMQTCYQSDQSDEGLQIDLSEAIMSSNLFDLFAKTRVLKSDLIDLYRIESSEFKLT